MNHEYSLKDGTHINRESETRERVLAENQERRDTARQNADRHRIESALLLNAWGILKMTTLAKVLRDVPALRERVSDDETLKSLSRVNRDCRAFVDHHPRWTQPLLQEIFPLDLGLPVILSPLDTPKALVAGYERYIYGCTYPKGHDHVLWRRFRAAWQRLGRTEFKVWWPTHDVKDLKKKYDREQTWINVRFMALGAVISLGMGAALGLSVGVVPGIVVGCVVFAVLVGVSEICHRAHISPFKAFTAQNMARADQSAEETADLQEAIDAL